MASEKLEQNEKNEQKLEKTEKTEKNLVFRPSWKNYFWHYILMFAVVALLVFVAVKFNPVGWMGDALYIIAMITFIVVVIRMMLNRFDERFTVKPDEVTMEHGILNKSSTEIGIMQIRTIQVNQTIWQRIFNIGDILIASAGTEGYEITAHGINNPHKIRDLIQSYIRNRPESAEQKHQD